MDPSSGNGEGTKRLSSPYAGQMSAVHNKKPPRQDPLENTSQDSVDDKREEFINQSDDQQNKYGEASNQLSRHELTTRLYLANLSTIITEQDLKDLFAPYHVKHVALLSYHTTACSTGYGLVDVAIRTKPNVPFERLMEKSYSTIPSQ